ncbi:ABC transporter permease subunit [bacterium]|nr:ABC transporter permease subunit [candidate division CSSED10-310 bacterium]
MGKDLKVVIFKELLTFVRDRNILIYSVLFPIFLYPLTFWVMNQIMLFQRGAVESRPSKVVVENAGFAPEFYALLDNDEYIEPQLADAEIGSDGVDLKIRVCDAFTTRGGPCFTFTILHDTAYDGSDVAKSRVQVVLDEYRDLLMDRVAMDHGLPLEAVRGYDIETINVASQERMGTFIIGRVLPMMIIIMAAMGTLYPSIDVIVGERERRTLETTLLTPTPRLVIVMGKFIAVVVAGVAAVLLNIGSLALTAGHTLFLMSGLDSASFTIPSQALPLIMVTAVIVSAGFAAVSILIASYARTFREGQSFVTPFFVLSFQPAVVAVFPSVKLTVVTAFVPVVNAALMFREVIDGRFDWCNIALVLLSLTVFTAVALGFAARRISRENTLWGDRRRDNGAGWKNGGLLRWLKR